MAIKNFVSGVRNLWLGTYDAFDIQVLSPLANGSGVTVNDDQIATVHTCIKILSDTLSRMPLNIYSDKGEGRTVDKRDYRYPILHYNPNNYTTQQTFFSALEYWRNLKGNAFALIHRNDNKLVSLEIIPPSHVIGYVVVDNQLFYQVRRETEDITIRSRDILHFKGLTRDGVWGINPVEALRLNINTSYKGMKAIDSFYNNNAMTPKAIKSTVSGANQKAMLEALDEFKSKYAGVNNSGTMIPLPPNTELVDITMNLADAEFIATMKYNTIQIASLYGVPPHMVGILEATKFNNVEQMMLDFKASTLTAIARAYRQELESKLLTSQERINGLSIEFNLNALVEADSKTRIDNLRALATTGVITPNDIAKLEGWPTFPQGDVHLIPANYISLENYATKPIKVE